MAQPNQMNNLTTLIKRLEAATSRLEDLATVVPPSSASSAVVPVPSISAPGAAAPAPQAPPPPPPEPLPASVEEFDELIDNEVAKYVKLSEELGGLIAEQSKAVQSCFAEQRKFLIITTKAKKPDPSSQLFMDLLSGMQVEMTKVSNISESNRASPYINNLRTVSEGTPALAWVTELAKPAKFVVEMAGAAKFYGDRVLRERKDKDPKHVEWVQSYHAIMAALEEYVKKHHPMGVTWNAKGIDPAEALKAASSPGTVPAGGAPPPPPPPPPPPGPAPILSLDGPSTPKPAGGDFNAVFDQLNRGEAVTAGLKKVDKSQMTHKNPELRNSSVVPAARPGSSGSLRGKSPAPPLRAKPASLTKKKPPKMELEGIKWIVENYENERNLVIEETERNQSVFLFRCKNTTIQIKGKVNQITINECAKTNVVADSLVSGIDVIKSNSFAIQVMHQVPTIQVDQCDGGTIYVSEESLGVEVFTSKTTAVNVYIPGAGDGGDYAERAVPEQLRHTIKDGQLVSEIVEHAG